MNMKMKMKMKMKIFKIVADLVIVALSVVLLVFSRLAGNIASEAISCMLILVFLICFVSHFLCADRRGEK